LKLGKFFFDKNKSTVTAAMALELDKVVDAVSRFPQLKLRIETHTNSKGMDFLHKQNERTLVEVVQ